MDDDIRIIEVTTAGSSETQLSAVGSAQLGSRRSSSCNCRDAVEAASLTFTSLKAKADEESVAIDNNDNDSTVSEPSIADVCRLIGKKIK
ncbi:Hypothetical protein CINCED_3A005402 [Cinara cedri]|uniref:Uncharacterized protein n=1 Tax=Cinara cedri TaxID=506608 RepID=A0A5E4N1Q0_9HEMI|nr:Hypothetical protein CINCED_3A005402 [Cinara cedri]